MSARHPMSAPQPGIVGEDFSPISCGCFCLVFCASGLLVLFFLVPALVLPWRFWFA